MNSMVKEILDGTPIRKVIEGCRTVVEDEIPGGVLGYEIYNQLWDQLENNKVVSPELAKKFPGFAVPDNVWFDLSYSKDDEDVETLALDFFGQENPKNTVTNYKSWDAELLVQAILFSWIKEKKTINLGGQTFKLVDFDPGVAGVYYMSDIPEDFDFFEWAKKLKGVDLQTMKETHVEDGDFGSCEVSFPLSNFVKL